jgi:FSR family fosmidomycin resistance protein-like MFS transporter
LLREGIMISRLNRIGIGTGGAPVPVLFFACAAHFMHHVLVSLFLTLVISLTVEWGRGYAELIVLWTIGSLMIGLGAPLAGWLGDRWGESRVMVLLFFGLGLASIACGLARSPAEMNVALTALGLFGALYHPVGNAWVVKHARERGKAIAAAGIFGSFGVAAGPVIAGVLNDAIDWRWAFILPGLATMAFGAALVVMKLLGLVPEREGDAHDIQHEAPTARDRRNIIIILGVTMTLTLIAVTAFVTALPKLIETLELGTREGLTRVGLLTGAIYLAASGAQFVGGHLADRGAARLAYLRCFAILAATLAAAALTDTWVLVPLAIAVMFLFETIAPIETVFVARYAPAGKRGLFFGMRYAISVVGGPAGVWLVSSLYDPAHGFSNLLLALAGMAVVTGAIGLLLPQDKPLVAAPN